MKVLEKDYAANQTGRVKMMAEEADDVWLLYNLIFPGDVVTADTTRKVHLESGATKKKNTTARVKLTLPVKVTCRDFHKDSSTLRVHGRTLEPNPHVAAGSFHTLTLQTNKPFDLHKKLWGPPAIETLREATENSTSSSSSSDADVAVVVLQQNHQAEIHLIGKGVTTRCSKIEASSQSHSRKGSSNNKENNAFFREVFGALVKHVDFNVVKSVVIASDDNDGSRNTKKDEFRRFVVSEARRLRMKLIEENKSRIVVAGCKNNNNNNGEFDWREVLGDSAVMKVIKESGVGVEIRAMRELWEMVTNDDSGRACYGRRNVESAVEMRAIDTLLISDDLYRNAETGTRQRYRGLVRSVKEGGGKALVYPSMHVSAPQLDQLTGVAAILRFPLPHLQDNMDDDHDHDHV